MGFIPLPLLGALFLPDKTVDPAFAVLVLFYLLTYLFIVFRRVGGFSLVP